MSIRGIRRTVPALLVASLLIAVAAAATPAALAAPDAAASALLSTTIATEDQIAPRAFAVYSIAKVIRLDGTVVESDRYRIWRRSADGRARIYDEAAQSNRFGNPELGDPLVPLSRWNAPPMRPSTITRDYVATGTRADSIDGRIVKTVLLAPSSPRENAFTELSIDAAARRVVDIKYPGTIPISLTVNGKAQIVSIPVVYEITGERNGSVWSLRTFKAEGASSGHRIALTYAVTNVETPADVPDWYFDQRAFETHTSGKS